MLVFENLRWNLKVGGAGFEPAKAEPTDLQSVPFDRFGNPPDRILQLVAALHSLALRFLAAEATKSQRRGSNPRPAVYKTAALPIELRRRFL